MQQVVTFLLDGNNSKRSLTNPAHVIWAMEVCGQGFCLPIEEEESISKVINLYRIWALEPNQRPSSISENLQFFLQVKTHNLTKSSLEKQIQEINLFFFSNQRKSYVTTRYFLLQERTLKIFWKNTLLCVVQC